MQATYVNHQERVKKALLRQPVDQFPVFMSATPQFMQKTGIAGTRIATALDAWTYCVQLNLDVVQIGHPSFYPVRVLDLPQGARYTDDLHRSHVIAGYYDEFCAPFPLQASKKNNPTSIAAAWNIYEFPDPEDPKWFEGLDAVVAENEKLDDPLSIWGVINGPFEPAWQLISDGWPEYYILARRDRALAKDIIEKVADYSIAAGKAMIDHGVHAIRIGDDYAINDGPMVAVKTWLDLVYPAHQKLIAGLKNTGGDDFPVILHTDGNVMDLLPHLGKSGIDALNPIQPGAVKLDEVVAAIGHKLSMTGAFDLRYFLEPNTPATREDMAREVQRQFDIINTYNEGENRTGFCIGPSHQIQAGSNVDTFEAWVRIVHDAKKNVR
jgi:uroporphyrinogen-III decarboxylase